MTIGNDVRDRNVTAVLGPTNTGKTHLALERLLAHKSGIIGLPLRLLAREVYDRIVKRIGADEVALITGEEKIKPEKARYWVSTVEAMPRDLEVEFLAIDEVQLAGDPERGHVFTDRLLNARGREETLLLGAQTMAGAIADLVPGANFISRPRLSQLTYSGQKKITRLPRRSAVVAFSAQDVYSIAELMRRQRGGAAVVLGGLSPRTRNAQVALYQSGDVDFLVATDAIGMGLNLDVDHVAFSAVRKFDGERHRNLTPSELAQIAGRAGRHMNDGTFGVTGDAEPFEPELVERLETHQFDALKKLQWRNTRLDFASLDALRASLAELPNNERLMRARASDDVLALEAACRDSDLTALASNRAGVEKLWDVCQIPDYRKISNQNHAEMISTIYKHLMGPEGVLPEDWIARQVDQSDRVDGDIDTLSNRIAHIRTWTFVSNRGDWLKDPAHWQGRAREIEDKLSDALHEKLIQRFVDKRTSALMKGMRDKDELFAEIAKDGAVYVEKHLVGKLQGFRFTPEDQSSGLDGKAARNAAARVLAPELAMRARRVSSAKADALSLNRYGKILWRDQEIAAIEAGEDQLKPQAVLLCDEHLSGPDKEKVQAKINSWLADTIAERLKPLVELSKADDVSGLAKGIAFQLKEAFGCLRRESVAEDIRNLDQPSRAQLRKYGVRFGAFNIYFPLLLKPAPADLLLALWTLKEWPAKGITFDNMPEPPRPGLTSLPADPKLPSDYYRVTGFHLCGPRAVRCDILERLADLIRPLLAWRENKDKPGKPPAGATGDGGFTVLPDMMSILGCSGEELAEVLKALGFKPEQREVKPETVAPAPAPASAVAAAAAGAGVVKAGPSIASAAAQMAIAKAKQETAAAEAKPEAAEGAKPEAAAGAGPAAAAGAGDSASAAPAQEQEETKSAASGEAVPATKGAEAEAASDSKAHAAADGGKSSGSEVSDGDSSDAEAAIGKADEPKVIEVWRPARRRQHGKRDSAGQRARGRTGADANRGAGGRRDHAASKSGDAQAGAAVRGDGGNGRGERTAGTGRNQKRRSGGRGNDANRSASGAGGGPRGREGGRDEQGRRGRPGNRSGQRNDRQQGRGKPQVHSAGPSKKKKGIDPDSPFAALGSLKKQLEKKSEEQSSS